VTCKSKLAIVSTWHGWNGWIDNGMRIKLVKKAEEKEVKPKNRKEAGELARARWSTLGVGKKK